MHADPQRDWLDEMLAQQPSWDPPAGFAARVVDLAGPLVSNVVLPPRHGWASYAADQVRGLRAQLGLLVTVRLEGVAWVARQYWTVFQR